MIGLAALRLDDRVKVVAMADRVPVVHIVDDDDDVRQSLAFLLQSIGIVALTYPDATTFLEEFDPDEPGVVIVDVRMPGLSGFQLQERLVDIGYPGPIIFCSAHGDIPMSVRAMRAGAVDFLEKPYVSQRVVELVQAQTVEAVRAFARQADRKRLQERLDDLTPRERDVLRLVVDGLSSQMIARRLGTSVKTIDVHRARIKSKTDADSLRTLVHDILLHRVSI